MMEIVILGAAYFDWLYEFLGQVMAFFFGLIPSYGFAIIMLTVTVRVLLIPLTAKQVKSQRAMQTLQPELKKLQAKYKGDRQRLNEEMMKLYKEHKANPLAGCLPLILQMPLFIILYRLIIDLSKVPPRHIPVTSELHRALVESQGRLESFGMNLAERPASVIGVLLVAAVVGTGYYQQKQMTARLPKDSVNPQMQMVGKVFPVFFGLISLSVPAGVVLYFVVSNIWQIGQQAVAFRNQEPIVAADEPQATGKTGAGKSGGGGGGGAAPPTKGGGASSKGGGPKGGGPSAKSGGTAKSGAGGKGGGAKPGGGGGGGKPRPPSGRVTPKGGGKTSGRVTPKGGPSAGAAKAGQRGATATPGGSTSSNKPTSAGSAAGGSAGDGSSNGESRWSRLSPMNRPAKPKRPPPAARPKGLPPTKGSPGGSSRKET